VGGSFHRKEKNHCLIFTNIKEVVQASSGKVNGLNSLANFVNRFRNLEKNLVVFGQSLRYIVTVQ
jgi:hypothetical protein